MANFYDQWLNYWSDEEDERSRARKYIHEEQLEWVKTKQDFSAALLCAPENGFITAGAAYMAIIPRGWHTGKHTHGEEAIYILSGQGCSVVDGQRYDWEKGSCLFMPFGLVHQHFNTGDDETHYLSFMGLALERFAGMAKFDQHEETGQTRAGDLQGIQKAKSDIHPEYGRIVLHLNDAPVFVGEEQAKSMAIRKDEFTQSVAEIQRTPGYKGHRSRVWRLMGSPENDFKAREVEITGILCDEPGMHSGKHAHMEALLYVLQGEGYSIVGDEKIKWKKGTLFQVQGPHTPHQHFNTGTVESQHLRIHYGLRFHYFQALARRVFPHEYLELSSYASKK